jgi:hypothetical protein
LISEFDNLSDSVKKAIGPHFKKDRLASHDLLNDIQRAFVKSKAWILHQNRNMKISSVLINQIIEEGVKENLWAEDFSPGENDFDKYLMTRLKNEKKSLSKKAMLDESAMSISSLMSSTLDADVLEDVLSL